MPKLKSSCTYETAKSNAMYFAPPWTHMQWHVLMFQGPCHQGNWQIKRINSETGPYTGQRNFSTSFPVNIGLVFSWFIYIQVISAKK